jgi:putative transcriptional regulator
MAAWEEDELLAILGLTVPPAATSAPLRARVLSSLEVGGRYGVFADCVARLFDLPIEAARQHLQRLEECDTWRPGAVAGIEMRPVRPGPRCAGAITTFLRLAPGVVFPRHSHVAEEISLVLDGGLRDSTGQKISRGGELYKPPGSEHDLAALSGPPCIAATIAFGGIEFLPDPHA